MTMAWNRGPGGGVGEELRRGDKQATKKTHPQCGQQRSSRTATKAAKAHDQRHPPLVPKTSP